jgi:FtsP/CotA-like multicopper oxidase with cupredoxin domain
VIDLADGASFELRIAPVAVRLGKDTVRMLAYNGSVPGPTLRVRQGSEISVRVRNDGDVEATVHWHGVRVENRYDGVPHETQAPIPIGDEFTYRVRFPDPGLYWYHPHIREDYGLDMGLYGNIIVVPAETDYWPPVNREVVVTLDDLLLQDGQIAPFFRDRPTHVAMGRFGNVMLTGGETNLEISAHAGEVMRFYLTNTANTRLFNVSLPGARMKLVGGDSGRYEQENFVERVLLAPSERAIIDVLFPNPGWFTLEYRTPDRRYVLADIAVDEAPMLPVLVDHFQANLRTSTELAEERIRSDAHRNRAPDKTLILKSLMPSLDNDRAPAATDAAAGPTSDHDSHDTTDGVEWEDLMEMNATSTPNDITWQLIDADTGQINTDIDWTFRVGDQVKLRLINDTEQDHPTPHPFHIHGAGRFVVLARDGAPDPNLVWKDTVLVRAGEIVDILLDVTNPGLWVAHCHIPEHHQIGMLFRFRVGPAERAS